MMSFVFYLRRLPDSLATASRPVRWLTKATPLLAIGMLQATVVVGLLGLGLRIPLAHPFHVWLIAVLGSVTFVSIVLFLITLLGDAGRLLAVVLLILQLAGAGGIYPVALSHPFYQKVHDWLPFTHMLRALRATMFGAFEGRWESSAGILALFAAGAIIVGFLLARWKMVPRKNYGPAVEF
jgi:putative membrane protein